MENGQAGRARRIVSIVRELSTWCPPTDAVRDLLTHMGAYTDVLVESWNVEGPTDAAIAWTDPHTLPSDAIDLFHDKGIRVMVLAGGGRGGPAWAVHNAVDYAGALADFVRTNAFDGVNLAFYGPGWGDDGPQDIDEEIRRSDWVCEVTRALRRALPTKSISHASDARCFGPHEGARFRRIHARVGQEVDFYVVRYCGLGDDHLNSASLFSVAPQHMAGTAIDELIAAGFPAEKLVIGTPVSVADGQGYIELSRFASMLRARVEEQRPIGGVCGWYWASDRKVLAGTWSTTVADALLGARRVMTP